MTRKRSLSHICTVALFPGLIAIAECATAASPHGGVTHCTVANQGMSLCAQVGAAVHRCVRDEPCEQHTDAKNRLDRSRFWFLRRLFI